MDLIRSGAITNSQSVASAELRPNRVCIVHLLIFSQRVLQLNAQSWDFTPMEFLVLVSGVGFALGKFRSVDLGGINHALAIVGVGVGENGVAWVFSHLEQKQSKH